LADNARGCPPSDHNHNHNRTRNHKLDHRANQAGSIAGLGGEDKALGKDSAGARHAAEGQCGGVGAKQRDALLGHGLEPPERGMEVVGGEGRAVL